MIVIPVHGMIWKRGRGNLRYLKLLMLIVRRQLWWRVLQNRQLLGILLVHLFDPYYYYYLFGVCDIVFLCYGTCENWISWICKGKGEIRGIKRKAHIQGTFIRILTQCIYTAIDITYSINYKFSLQQNQKSSHLQSLCCWTIIKLCSESGKLPIYLIFYCVHCIYIMRRVYGRGCFGGVVVVVQ